ncbi:uncharacterized protein PFL1_05114 [Pseudozyma flocculosa PF-1]|uniref:Uncharacterized protein n=2 Tax=Pseudozyma flocculosa TaxID=84751 RepID=A0A5C3F6B8_9BASI|nr:uncharacterized protein PFL1_05114 [Pseudozyma flocculosa PF-1]EPQ27191.1 hypothetical protein PFL1_05114 [Pseudozyma flocculosa PF-1]SPO39556.1 uncharacterized protein PSFLO_05037 [Pseudozyma flocculosa]
MASAPSSSAPPSAAEQRVQDLARFCQRVNIVDVAPCEMILGEALGINDIDVAADFTTIALKVMIQKLLPYHDHPELPLFVKTWAIRRNSSGEAERAPLVGKGRLRRHYIGMLEDFGKPTWFQAAEYLICRCFFAPSVVIPYNEWDERDHYRQLCQAFAAPDHRDGPQQSDNESATADERSSWKTGPPAPPVPIIESSGTGNIHKAHDLRHQWPTLVLTLRKDADAASQGLPVAESGVAEVCTELEKSNKAAKPPASMGELFALWHPSEDASGPGKEANEVAFQEVCDSADLLRKKRPNHFQGPVVHEQAKSARAPVSKEAEDRMHLAQIMGWHLVPILTRLERLICEAGPVKAKQAELGEYLREDHPAILYIVIDGVRHLDAPGSSAAASASLHQCLSLMPPGSPYLRIWHVLLDTPSAVSESIPAQTGEGVGTSAEAAQGGDDTGGGSVDDGGSGDDGGEERQTKRGRLV